MKERIASRGFALVFVVLAMLVIVPLAMFVVQKTINMNHNFWTNRVGSAARRISDNLAVDYMSQFAKGNSYYENHFSTGALQRTKTFFESGYGSADVEFNSIARTVQITARGDYGRDPGNPKSSKSLQALYYFVPMLGQYGLEYQGSGQFGIPLMTVRGPVRVGNDLLVTADDVTFNETVIAGNNISAMNSTIFKSQVFYGNTHNGGVYQGGPPISGVPPGGPFPIDTNYFRINSTTQSIGINAAWDFRQNAGVAQFRSRYDLNTDYNFSGPGEDWGNWTDIPASGGIFYVENAKTYLSGTVAARVTVVCSAPPSILIVSSNSMGIVEIDGSFGYPPGPVPQSYANTNQSLFVIATYGMVFFLPNSAPAGSTLRVSGAYCVTDPVYGDNECNTPVSGTTVARQGTSGRTGDFFNFLGSWNNMGMCYHFSGQPTINFDPNLQMFPAPGVPERPVLVSWRRR